MAALAFQRRLGGGDDARGTLINTRGPHRHLDDVAVQVDSARSHDVRFWRELLTKTLPELEIVRAMMAGRAYAAVAYLFARSRIERARAITGPLTGSR